MQRRFKMHCRLNVDYSTWLFNMIALIEVVDVVTLWQRIGVRCLGGAFDWFRLARKCTGKQSPTRIERTTHIAGAIELRRVLRRRFTFGVWLHNRCGLGGNGCESWRQQR